MVSIRLSICRRQKQIKSPPHSTSARASNRPKTRTSGCPNDAATIDRGSRGWGSAESDTVSIGTVTCSSFAASYHLLSGDRARIRLDRMGTSAGALRHASRRYRRVARWAVHPVRGVESEARHLHEIERAGESGETPFIAMLGLALFLGSVFLVMLGVAFLAYYLS